MSPPQARMRTRRWPEGHRGPSPKFNGTRDNLGKCVGCTLAVDRSYEAYRRPYIKDRPVRGGLKTVGSVDGRNPTQAWRSRRARYACDNERRSTGNDGSQPRSLRAAGADVDFARLPSSTYSRSGGGQGQGRTADLPLFRESRKIPAMTIQQRRGNTASRSTPPKSPAGMRPVNNNTAAVTARMLSGSVTGRSLPSGLLRLTYVPGCTIDRDQDCAR